MTFLKKISLVWLLFLLHKTNSVPHCVEIIDAGSLPIVKNHIGIHFFVTVTNIGPDSTEVEVVNVQCCEELPGALSDCSRIHLIPETKVMEPNTTHNLTLIHPTLYPYNRRGECLLAVRYMTTCNRSKEARQHIAFDTSLNEENVRYNMIQGFASNEVDGAPCKSHDEDSLNDCKMVDCHKKYFGLKSFFNKGSRVCEPVPACITNKRRTTIYDVTTNRCSDLSGCLSEDDLQHLSHADLEPECIPQYSDKMPFVDCHHGDLSNVSSDCMCNLGYQAAIVPEEPGNPRTQVFHSCNLDTICWSWRRLFSIPDDTILLIALLMALVVIIGAMLIFTFQENY